MEALRLQKVRHVRVQNVRRHFVPAAVTVPRRQAAAPLASRRVGPSLSEGADLLALDQEPFFDAVQLGRHQTEEARHDEEIPPR